MKREIKFRVWDKQTKKMSPDFVLFGEFTMLGAVHDWQHECGNKAQSSLHALNDLEEMQYTGLKDKNGKEIYEGDVIDFELGDNLDNEKGVVRFSKDGFWTSTDGDLFEEVLSEELKDLPGTVIGNIWEHPELVSSSEIPTEK